MSCCDGRTVARGEAIEVAHAPVPEGTLSWHNVPHPVGGHMIIHCLPVNDIGLHRLDEGCACRPVEDARTPDYFVHNAFDGREDYQNPRSSRRPH